MFVYTEGIRPCSVANVYVRACVCACVRIWAGEYCTLHLHVDVQCITYCFAAFHDVCTEAMVKDVAQSMIDQGLHAAGYTRVNLDDCWEATTRDPKTNATRADPSRFPSGTVYSLFLFFFFFFFFFFFPFFFSSSIVGSDRSRLCGLGGTYHAC